MNLLNLIAMAAPQAAEGAQQKPANPWITFAPFIIIIVVMFFMTARSQKKQQAKRDAMMARLVKGSKVILASGIMGTIVEVREKSSKVEIAPDCVVEVLPNAIVEVLGAEEKTEAAK